MQSEEEREHAVVASERVIQLRKAIDEKEAKENARKAFTKARRVITLQELLSGLERYVDSVKGKERQYIALPASWLNAGRWQDEIPDATKPAANSPWNKDFYK